MSETNRVRLLLVFLLACQGALVVLLPGARLNGDEPYYAGKARYFFEHHRFEHVSAEDLAAERGERWGNSDWRPQGYPLFVAAVSPGDFREATLRPRVTAVQFALIAAALWVLFEIVARRMRGFRLVVAVIVLGAAPWPFEFVASITPDSLTASVTFFSLVLLWLGSERENKLLLFAGSFLLSTTLLLRPEMIALVPFVLLAATLLRRADRRTFLKRGAACASAFAIVVGLQLAYRTEVTGRPGLFGGLHIRDAGAFEWVNTWLGSENEAYNFIYGLSNGELGNDLPARAFSNDEERRIVGEVIRRDRLRGDYGADLDATFHQLAEKRRREHPFLSIVGTRVWHSIHLWLNLEMNSQLLNALTVVPRPIRRPFLGMLCLAKPVLLALFAVGTMRWKRSTVPGLIALCAVLVIGRTLLVGGALNWMVHRYVLNAWLPLLACAIAGLQTWPALRHHPRGLRIADSKTFQVPDRTMRQSAELTLPGTTK